MITVTIGFDASINVPLKKTFIIKGCGKIRLEAKNDCKSY